MSEDHGEAIGPDLLRVLNGMRTSEDPRAITILPCAYLELHLTTLLKKKLPGLENTELWERFFGNMGFATEISKKIYIAQALGILEPKLAKRIATIAKIRNKFAHRLDVADFDHPDVAGLVDSLASTNSPEPQIRVEGKLVPLLKKNRGGLFIREAISACGRFTDLLTDGLGFEHTDETIPEGMPGMSRFITFGGTKKEEVDPPQG